MGQVNLTSMVTGTLPTGSGGTGSTANANAAGGVVVLDASSKLPAVDGSQLTNISTSFGAWVDKSSSYEAQQAATDGFVIVYALTTNTGQNYATLYTDSNSNPTTIRGALQLDANDYPDRGQLFTPVKKNDYWKVVLSGTITSLAVYWIPLGS